METTIKLLQNKRIHVSIYHLVLLILAIWLVWNLAEISRLLIPNSKIDTSRHHYKTSLLPQKNSVINNHNIQSINKLSLFGKVETTVGSVKQSKLTDINAPETKLNLKLMGLRHGSGTIKSSAIIEGPDKKQAIFYIGDTLPMGNAVVEEIFIQHMILSRQGKYETLTLFTILNATQQTSKSNDKIGQKNVTDLTRNKLITNKLNEYKKIALEDPRDLDAVIDILPKYDEDKFVGYELLQGDDAELFNEAGLKEGDILTSLNGVTLDEEDKIYSMTDSFVQGSILNITLNRNGKLMSFRYLIK